MTHSRNSTNRQNHNKSFRSHECAVPVPTYRNDNRSPSRIKCVSVWKSLYKCIANRSIVGLKSQQFQYFYLNFIINGFIDASIEKRCNERGNLLLQCVCETLYSNALSCCRFSCCFCCISARNRLLAACCCLIRFIFISFSHWCASLSVFGLQCSHRQCWCWTGDVTFTFARYFPTCRTWKE